MDLSNIKHWDGIDRREDLSQLITQHSYKTGIEIGVDRGAFSASLLFRTDSDFTLYGLDRWSKYPDRKIEAENLLKAFKERSRLIVGLSPAAASQFADGYFDFIYIDGDHRYRPVRSDLNAFWPKLRPGGLMSGHDYVERKMCGVIRAVDEFVTQNNLVLYTTKEDGPLPTDQLISWFFFKPKP